MRWFPRLLLSCFAFVAPIAIAQEDSEDSPYRSGLVATYMAGNSAVTRLDEVVAFDWQDAACDERVPAGPFSASWRGRLWARSAGKYQLFCYVQGEVTVKLAGKSVVTGRAEQVQWLASQPLELEFDYHKLEIAFRKTAAQARLALFWSGPDFQLEPISERFLLHERQASPSLVYERGRELAAALRCVACHRDEHAEIAAAPALDRLTGNLQERWIVDWLATDGNALAGGTLRRMPHFSIERDEAAAVAAWLLRESNKTTESKKNEQKEAKVAKESEKKSDKSAKKAKAREDKPKPSAALGEQLLLTRGCLACHRIGSLGESGLFGGGDLTTLLSKRPVGFLVRWLDDPAAINRSHRMPVFSLTSDERDSLRLWEEAQAKLLAPEKYEVKNRAALTSQGEKLVSEFRCANCHLLSRDASALAAAGQSLLTRANNWSRSCGGDPDNTKKQPGYRLSKDDQSALQLYYSQSHASAGKLSAQARGRDLLVRLNCLACHQREGVDRRAASLPARLQDKLATVAKAHDDLAALVPAMTPPALNSVGDKLLDNALADAISRQGPPHRPYLLVQMPKFDLTKDQLASLVAYFTAADRIPRRVGVPPALANTAGETPTPRLLAAGPRLVTADGLSCTSCHQVGSVLPSKAPLNARGPDMTMLGKRIRHEWFDRWCADPARIVPRMEMPSVKVPVRGVLDEKIDDQLSAVWHILNTPGFEPPEPNPVRVLRLSGVPERNEKPIVIHDVFKDGDKTYLYPLVIGLPNRHNILFDLETNRLAAWWLGDTARQRTKGKSWWWEMGGKPIHTLSSNEGFDPELIVDGKTVLPKRVGQFASEISHWGVSEKLHFATFSTHLYVPLQYRDGSDVVATVDEIYSPLTNVQSGGGGFERELTISLLPTNTRVRLRLLPATVATASKWNSEKSTLDLPSGDSTIRLRSRYSFSWYTDGTITLATSEYDPVFGFSQAHLTIDYKTRLPNDQYLTLSPPETITDLRELEVRPGFEAARLPLPMDIMPSGIAWKPDGTMVFSSLKGQVFGAKDTDGDGAEDSIRQLVDGLATPYGLAVPAGRNDRIEVAAKTGLTRLAFSDYGPSPTVCNDISPWGRTDDYHDWAVGPIPGENGELFVALPCQQDQRSEAAADYRGKILKLVPRQNTLDKPQHFDVEVISAGHRFPMGLARNRDGELFVTDNQGNYNPFNELNHVRKGSHFGFINALEKEQGYKPPPLTPPAINIPHPWTRSVNGICFLETPDALRRVGSAHQNPDDNKTAVGTAHPTVGKSIFGPLEGHLIGCEYDTRRLIRMTLQKVGDTYQGCAYPLSIPPADVEKGLLGPIVCAIKPTTGELYVGEIRDSGWGASNNIGQIVKIKIEPEKLPCGIAEVRATSTGFTIDFFQPVDRTKAADVTSYSVSSYRRESTPAYGGPDLDRRSETISTAILSPDRKRVTLTLPELRPGFVYELRLKNLAADGGMFHPDEAHYTLNQIPE